MSSSFKRISALIGFACLLTIAGRAQAQGRCVLRSEAVELDRVTVKARDAEPFEVHVRRARVIATIGDEGTTRVAVKGSLIFNGVTSRLHLRFTDYASSRFPPIAVRPETALVNPRRSDDGTVLVDIPLARGVTLVRHRVRCDQLSLAPRPSPPAPPVSLPDHPVQYPNAPELEVWQEPGKGTKVTLDVPNPFHLPLEVRTNHSTDVLGLPVVQPKVFTSNRGSFLKVQAALPEGLLDGFVSTGSLTSHPPYAGHRGGGMGRGSCGCMGPERRWARIAAGTKVLSGPDAQPWATVADQVYGVVSTQCTAGYARLYHTDDVRGLGQHELLEHAWVPVAALSTPRGGS